MNEQHEPLEEQQAQMDNNEQLEEELILTVDDILNFYSRRH